MRLTTPRLIEALRTLESEYLAEGNPSAASAIHELLGSTASCAKLAEIIRTVTEPDPVLEVLREADDRTL